jgi:glutamate formiminotransferase / 5-formyltetrahydrofolate cyclo-ligase
VKIVECVPNISEGRDETKIAAVTAEIEKHEGVRLLNVQSDKDHHRSVITFIGEPLAVKAAALAMALKAIELIDMRSHRGAHPRMGAVDVVPFVPIQGVEMEETVATAREFGRELGRRGIPVYYYEEAATSPLRRDLPAIRKGEYEGFAEKMKDPQWKPDEGPSAFNARSGATVVGARFPLIAYNVNLRTDDLALAKEIARKVRFKDGGFPHVRAMGVDLKEKGMVQVSMNLTHYRVTGMPAVYAFIREEAARHGAEVAESEIVGLIPLGAVEGVFHHFLQCPDFSIHQVIEQRVLASDDKQKP